jgi:hypothetical protein
MQPYPSQYPPVQPMVPRTSTTAIISLIAGLAGISVLPGLGSIIAIICGHMAKNEIKRSAGMVTGNGMATWGLVLGYIVVVGSVCGCIIAFTLTAFGVISIPIFNNILPSSY